VGVHQIFSSKVVTSCIKTQLKAQKQQQQLQQHHQQKKPKKLKAKKNLPLSTLSYKE
jgi:hypothetical protein